MSYQVLNKDVNKVIIVAMETWNTKNKQVRHEIIWIRGKIFIFGKILKILVWWWTFLKKYSFDANLVQTNPTMHQWAHGLIFIWNPGNFTARELIGKIVVILTDLVKVWNFF